MGWGILRFLFAALGLILLIPGLWLFVSLTAKPLHPDPAGVPTVAADLERAPQWLAPVRRARDYALAHLTGANLPGLSVAVGVDGELVWAEGFGFADLKTSMPVTPDHQFRIGSASQALTSAAVGLLLEENGLALDDEIQRYVPAFPGKQWPVTLRDLMGHTSGAADGDSQGPLFTKHCEQAGEALRYFAQDSLLFKPGTQYRYSVSGWILVSAAIEAAAKTPFLRFMRERVFDPLGMRHTIPDASTLEPGEDFPLFNMVRELIHDPEATRGSAAAAPARAKRDRATYYYPRFAANPKYGMHTLRPIDLSCYAGSSVFLSTPADLVRFGMAITGGKFLRPGTVDSLQTSQRLASGAETGHGLGWYRKTLTLGVGRQARVIGQDGNLMGGMAASLIMAPEDRIVVAVLSNIPHAGAFDLAGKVAETFAGQAAPTR